MNPVHDDVLTGAISVEAKKFRLRAVAKMREATLRTLLQMDASYPARYQARELERNKPKRSVHLH